MLLDRYAGPRPHCLVHRRDIEVFLLNTRYDPHLWDRYLHRATDQIVPARYQKEILDIERHEHLPCAPSRSRERMDLALCFHKEVLVI